MKCVSIFAGIFLLVIFVGCAGDNSETANDPVDGVLFVEELKEWLVPIEEIKDGGPGKDGIPSIDNPQFIGVSDAEAFISDEDLVVGMVINNTVKAYPHLILDWHEIVNDELNGQFYTLSYCPLTGTAFSWVSESAGTKSTYGVSGLLYNANLILYDRHTDSHWSQMLLQCINGDQIGEQPRVQQVIETDWATWKVLYPESEVLSLETGFNRSYGVYPYGVYKEHDDYFIFHAYPSNEALPNKQRVFALIHNEQSKVFEFESFSEGEAVKIQMGGTNFVVAGNENVAVAFELKNSESQLDFEYVENRSETFFRDNLGNTYSITGRITEGPDRGKSLKIATYVTSYWFAVAAFYPNPEIVKLNP